MNVSGAGGAGIHANGNFPDGTTPPGRCGFLVEDGTYLFNAGGGIVFEGSACGARLARPYLHGNTVVGIDLRSLGATTIVDAVVLFTRERAQGSNGGQVGAVGDRFSFGDGIRIQSTETDVRSSFVSFNARAGISVFQCTPTPSARLALTDNRLLCNAFDIAVETADIWSTGPTACDTAPSRADGGGNVCSRSASSSCGPLGTCRIETTGLSPVPR